MKHLPLFLFSFLTFWAKGQCTYNTKIPDELYRGRYQPVGAWTDHPFTMFNKKKPGWTLNSDLEKLSNNIKAGQPIRGNKENDFGNRFAWLYYTIYTSAVQPEPARCSETDNCPHAAWVKKNAVVHLIGLHAIPDSLGNVKFTDMNEAEAATFGMRAENGLQNLNPKIISCYGLSDCDNIAPKALGLMQYLQAYDLLKASGHISGDVRQNLDCSARSKLREYTRNLYIQSEDIINSFYGWKKNHGIICASVLGMAAIVLWDAGTETSVKSYLSGWLDGSGSVWPRPRYNPNKWMARALGTGGYSWFGGEDGLEDCFFTGNHAWPSKNVPMTNADGTAGYAEGPAYMAYACTALLPFMRAQANFLPKDKKPLLDDSRYQEMFRWFFNIQTMGAVLPTYDNTSVGDYNNLGLLGMEEWPGTPVSAGNTVELSSDYLLANGATDNAAVPDHKPRLKEVYVNPASGNAILRKSVNGSHHYFQMLYETGVAVDKPGLLDTHEDDDMGSFSLFADDEQLAIDPPYMGWGTHRYTNLISDHNVIGHYHDDKEATAAVSEVAPNGFLVTIDQGPAKIKRDTRVYETNHILYYMQHDKCESTEGGFDINIRGNGSHSESTFLQTRRTRVSSDNVYNVFTWQHPCANRNNKWSLLSHTAIANPAIPARFYFISDQYNIHGSGENVITQKLGYKEKHTQFIGSSGKFTDRPYGVHARAIIVKQSNQALFQTVLLPYRCNSDSVPYFSRLETPGAVTTFIEFVVQTDTVINPPYLAKKAPVYIYDTITDIHTAREQADSGSVTRPGSSDVVFSHAERAYLSVGATQMERTGACTPSITRFKKAEVFNGTELRLNDTPYIYTPYPATVYYEHKARFRYEGFVMTPYGANVTFRMPDLEPGYPVHCITGNRVLPSVQYSTAGADSFRLITVTFPAGTTNFTLELADPCQASCFFPPTDLPVDSVFVFDTGNREALDHDLDVIPGEGEFHISNGSKMSICSDFMFRNRDSLLLYAEDTDSSYVYRNPLDGPSTISTPVRHRITSGRSMIVVNDKAALVLDSGSFTHVGDNATILVLKGGTLLVRKHATLEIGGNESSNRRMFGEIIAEEGAYVCIEDSSSIYFYADTPTVDTQDVNVFYVNLDPYAPTIAGTNPLGARGRFIAPFGGGGTGPGLPFAGEYAGSACLPFCEIKLHRPPHGIRNRDFGWCNFSQPVAGLNLPLYACPGVPVELNGNRVLNETGYTLEVYSDAGLLVHRASTPDSPRFDGLVLPALAATDHYEIRLYLQNDCGERDTFETVITVAPVPVPAFTLAATGCQGSGHIVADGSASVSGRSLVPHVWHVQRIDTLTVDTAVFAVAGDYAMEWEQDTATAVDSAFRFPGFTWKGGYSYEVGLTLKGLCSDSTVIDTIYVPLGVDIRKDSLKIYPDIPGYTTTTIHAAASGYDTFYWEPPAGLTHANTLHPVAMPSATTQYKLVAERDGCIVMDSVVVRVLNCPWAGNDQTICKGDSVLIGVRTCTPPFYFDCYACPGPVVWKPDPSIPDVYQLYQYVKPAQTVTYTLELFMDAGMDPETGMPVYDTVDYDQVTITVIPRDTPSFEIAYQPDSLTFTFSNLSAGPGGTAYFWTFGDGDSSTLTYPTHTFPHYDSAYLVCLYAAGVCDTLVYCDTIKPNVTNYVSYGKRGSTVKSIDPEDPVKLKPSGVNTLGLNRPNPFDASTLVDYELAPGYTQAVLRITNMLGQVVAAIPLHAAKGTVPVRAEGWNSGIYYYSLVVDETVTKTRIMVVK